MRITKLGHSCLHVVDGSASILIDPGAFSPGFERLRGLTAVLVTHQHPDHVDVQRLPAVLENNPDAGLYTDEGTASVLAERRIEATAVHTGDVLDVGTRVEAFAVDHAIIHQDVPVIPNACYLVGDRLLHPGDTFTVPDRTVEILALPVSAPWMAVKEAVEYYRAVAPSVAIPIHEKVLANPAMVYGLLSRLGPQNARWTDLDNGQPLDL